MGCLKLADHQLLLRERYIQMPALTYRECTQNSCRFRCIRYRYQFTHPPDNVDHMVIWGYRIIIVDRINYDRRREPIRSV